MAHGKKKPEIWMEQRFTQDVQGDITGTGTDLREDFRKGSRLHESLWAAARLAETAGEIATVGYLNIYLFEFSQSGQASPTKGDSGLRVSNNTPGTCSQ